MPIKPNVRKFFGKRRSSSGSAPAARSSSGNAENGFDPASKTKPELEQLLKANGVHGYSAKSKPQLVALTKACQENGVINQSCPTCKHGKLTWRPDETRNKSKGTPVTAVCLGRFAGGQMKPCGGPAKSKTTVSIKAFQTFSDAGGEQRRKSAVQAVDAAKRANAKKNKETRRQMNARFGGGGMYGGYNSGSAFLFGSLLGGWAADHCDYYQNADFDF